MLPWLVGVVPFGTMVGRDRFERLRAAGACLTLDEAVALALGE